MEHRGTYYEKAGALRDMVQNHLLQVFSLVAMEPPVSLRADDVRGRAVDALRAIRPFDAGAGAPRRRPRPVRPRPDRGPARARLPPGSRTSPATPRPRPTSPSSCTSTTGAGTACRSTCAPASAWPTQSSEVVVEFRAAPHRVFPAEAVDTWRPNRLTLDIQPDEGVRLSFQVKRPGLQMRLAPAEMRFTYREAFAERAPEAYETLLLDVMHGDATLFKRSDQIEAAWRLMMPILDHWTTTPPRDFPDYAAGTWGPADADELLARDQRAWVEPDVPPDPDAARGRPPARPDPIAAAPRRPPARSVRRRAARSAAPAGPPPRCSARGHGAARGPCCCPQTCRRISRRRVDHRQGQRDAIRTAVRPAARRPPTAACSARAGDAGKQRRHVPVVPESEQQDVARAARPPGTRRARSVAS